MSGINDIIVSNDFKSNRTTTATQEISITKTKQVISRADAGAGRVESILQLAWSWKKPLEVWPFNVGLASLAAPSLLSSFLILRHFRSSLVLGEYARFSSYAVTFFIPLASSLGFHTHMTHRKNRFSDTGGPEGKYSLAESCRVCDQLYAGTVQVLTGVSYPIFLSIFTSFPTVTAVHQYNLPNIKKHPWKVAKYALEICKDMKGQLAFLAILNFVFAAGLVHFEKNCIEDVLLPNVESFMSGKYKIGEKKSSISDVFKK